MATDEYGLTPAPTAASAGNNYGLTSAAPSVSAPQTPLPPVAQNETIEDPKYGLTSAPINNTAGVTPNDHQTLSRLQQVSDDRDNKPDAWDNTFTGPGTIIGQLKSDYDNKVNPDLSIDSIKNEYNRISDKSLWRTQNSISDAEKTQHPHYAAFDEGVSDVLDSLGTPSNLALLVATYGAADLPKLLETTASKIPALASQAPKIALGAKAALTALGGVFSEEQIRAAIKTYPQILKDAAMGDTDRTIHDTTVALVNLGFGLHAGMHTLTGARGLLSELEYNKSLANKDIRKAVDDLHTDRTITEGLKKQTADLALKKIPDLAEREKFPDYIEANQDPKLLAERQKETIAGPKPSELIDAAQGKQVPFEEEKSAEPTTLYRAGEQVSDQPGGTSFTTNNATAARYEFGDRKTSQYSLPADAKLIDHEQWNKKVNETSPNEAAEYFKSKGYAGVDLRNTLGEKLNQAEGRGKQEIRIFEPDKLTPAPKTAEPTTTLHRAEGNPEGKTIPDWIKQGMEDSGSAAAQGRWFTDKQELLNWYKNDAGPEHVIKSVDIPTKDLEQFRVSNLPEGHPARKYSRDPENEFFVPRELADSAKPHPKSDITYRTDDNGLTWAKSPDSPAEVTIPKGLEGAESEKYAREKIELQKQFAASRAETATPNEETKPEEEPSGPATVHAQELQDALDKVAEARRSHIITPEERSKMAAQQDPNWKPSDEGKEYLAYRKEALDRQAKEMQDLGIIDKPRSNYVMHALPYDHDTNVTMQSIYPTMHEGQQAGIVYPNKDIGALDSDSIGNSGKRIAETRLINNLKEGKADNGAPVAVPGGYVEGQRVSSEQPKTFRMSDNEVAKRTKDGSLAKLVTDGSVTKDATGKFAWNTSKFQPLDLYENRPIGPTPIPKSVVEDMRTKGSLDELEKKGLVFKNDKGDYFSPEQLTSRVQLFGHPDHAKFINHVMLGKYTEPSDVLGKTLKGYDDFTGNMKSLLLAWSGFHKIVTEPVRLLEAFGITGLPDAVKTILNPKPVDYLHLTPEQYKGIRDGLITTGYSSGSNVAEGLAAGSNSWGGKSYKLFNTALEKLGVPESVRRNIDPQKIFTDNVFGPQGQITRYKFALYDKLKPEIIDVMKKDHPDWTSSEVDVQAGREAAKFANNKFGGFNLMLAGRALSDQRFLKRVMLAPDFLETTGRSILDLGSPYGKGLVSKLIQFQIAHGLTAAAINYALHRNEEDNSVAGALKAAHLEHPFSVLGPNGKLYSLRATEADAMHMISDPRDFIFDRINPGLRSLTEIAQGRNQYGRSEPFLESLKSVPKGMFPLGGQGLLGKLPLTDKIFAPNTTTEPSNLDAALKSFGISARPDRTDAEQYALGVASQRLSGQPARTGSDLAKSRLKFNAEDKLRAAYKIQDPEKKKAAIEDAKHDIKNLAMRRILDPNETKKIETDARGSRLKSIFNSLPSADPTDVLKIWDMANDDEKKELGNMMHAKFMGWQKNITEHGAHINSLNSDDQQTFDKFRQASKEFHDILHRPPEPVPQKKTEKPSASNRPAAAPENEYGLTAAPTAPAAPAVYKTGDYTGIANDAANRYGVNPSLVAAVIHQESLGDPNAESGKGAHGLMQLRPLTAKQYGVKNINDPEQNIDAGVHYLSDLLKRYGGDQSKALAAYNAGPGAVDDHNGVPPFKETLLYVKKILERLKGQGQ